MDSFPLERRAFALEAYFSNGNSYVAMVREFRAKFGVAFREPVPSRKMLNYNT